MFKTGKYLNWDTVEKKLTPQYKNDSSLTLYMNS